MCGHAQKLQTGNRAKVVGNLLHMSSHWEGVGGRGEGGGGEEENIIHTER